MMGLYFLREFLFLVAFSCVACLSSRSVGVFAGRLRRHLL